MSLTASRAAGPNRGLATSLMPNFCGKPRVANFGGATLTTICTGVNGHAESPGWGKQEGFTFSPTAIQAAILFSEEIFSGSKASYLCATAELARTQELESYVVPKQASARPARGQDRSPHEYELGSEPPSVAVSKPGFPSERTPVPPLRRRVP